MSSAEQSSFSDFDRAMMRRALALAQKGLYTATPNPRVGCVLVQGEQVVGEGWHEKTGAPHHRLVERGKFFHLRRFFAFTSCSASRKSSGVSKRRYTEAKRM